MKKGMLILMAVWILSGCAATARHGKSVGGPVEGEPGGYVSKMSEGTDVFFYPVTEPTPANELLAELKKENNCKELVNTEVDYRTKVMWYLLHGHPQVRVSGYCIR
ncbi:hypothetical protein [Candidatus Manganitrophus noduliformans]|uniref:Lipoprotein n=1 Tax=Candidatus Manganitrophus noduliformans TaxID=2606439 RepID=A0A7X6DN22_9BACT|nr:hypothetical protein [Candidatus Manganitrophus noduliformans]NKE70258.1 hypothetical protein [Candidatus Manganitrophus noduliformans]